MTRPVGTAARSAAEGRDAPAAEPQDRRTADARRLVGAYAAGVDSLAQLHLRLVTHQVWLMPGGTHAELESASARLAHLLAPVDAAVTAVRPDCDWCDHRRLCGRCTRNQDAVHDAVVATADAIVGGGG